MLSYKLNANSNEGLLSICTNHDMEFICENSENSVGEREVMVHVVHGRGLEEEKNENLPPTTKPAAQRGSSMKITLPEVQRSDLAGP